MVGHLLLTEQDLTFAGFSRLQLREVFIKMLPHQLLFSCYSFASIALPQLLYLNSSFCMLHEKCVLFVFVLVLLLTYRVNFSPLHRCKSRLKEPASPNFLCFWQEFCKIMLDVCIHKKIDKTFPFFISICISIWVLIRGLKWLVHRGWARKAEKSHVRIDFSEHRIWNIKQHNCVRTFTIFSH